MGKILSCLTVLLLLPLTAQAHEYKTYVGTDLQGLFVGSQEDGADLMRSAPWGSFVRAGARLHKYFGGEIATARTFGADRELWSTGAAMKMYDLAVDALGYVPLGAVELVGSAGFGWTQLKGRTEANLFPSGTAERDDLGLRFGGGAQYNVSENMNVRGMARYTATDAGGVDNRALSYTLGLNYTF